MIKGKFLQQGALVNSFKPGDINNGYVDIEVYSQNTRRCVLVGTICAVHTYGGLTILAIRDMVELFACAVVLNEDGSVTHNDYRYDMKVVKKRRSK